MRDNLRTCYKCHTDSESIMTLLWIRFSMIQHSLCFILFCMAWPKKTQSKTRNAFLDIWKGQNNNLDENTMHFYVLRNQGRIKVEDYGKIEWNTTYSWCFNFKIPLQLHPLSLIFICNKIKNFGAIVVVWRHARGCKTQYSSFNSGINIQFRLNR